MLPFLSIVKQVTWKHCFVSEYQDYLMYKFRKAADNPEFSDQFKKLVI